MNPDETENKKNKITLWIVGGFAIMTFSAIGTVLFLSYVHRTQVDNTAQSAQEKSEQDPQHLVNYRTLSAKSYKDFSAVCSGFKIENAPKFTERSKAVIATFTQSPRAGDTWLYEPVGYGKPFVQDNDYLKIDTVACLSELRDGRTLQKTCSYSEDGKQVSVKYYSVRYKLAYFEAQTGKRIADGGVIETPTDTCPAFAAYDQQTLSIYASPDAKALETSHADFTTR